jgi:hypothetical protein
MELDLELVLSFPDNLAVSLVLLELNDFSTYRLLVADVFVHLAAISLHLVEESSKFQEVFVPAYIP